MVENYHCQCSRVVVGWKSPQLQYRMFDPKNMEKSKEEKNIRSNGGISEKLNKARKRGRVDRERKGVLKNLVNKISVEPVVILINLGRCMIGVQISNLYIEKTCKVCKSCKRKFLWIALLLQVGSFFFGNGTTYSDEVLCETKDHYQLKYHVYHSRQILYKFQLEIVCKKNHFQQKPSFLRFATILQMELLRRSRKRCRR